jgi:hypothetical protein
MPLGVVLGCRLLLLVGSAGFTPFSAASAAASTIGALTIVIASAAFRLIDESHATERGRYDLPGALTSTIGLVSLVYGMSGAETKGWGSGTTITLLIVLKEGRRGASQPTARRPFVPDAHRDGSASAPQVEAQGSYWPGFGTPSS